VGAVINRSSFPNFKTGLNNPPVDTGGLFKTSGKNFFNLLMQKDHKYESIKFLIEAGLITSFYQIPDHVSQGTFCHDLGMNYNRFLRCLKDPREFTIKDILNLAAILDITPTDVTDLILKDYIVNKKK
jgi:hypothetical protein